MKNKTKFLIAIFATLAVISIYYMNSAKAITINTSDQNEILSNVFLQDPYDIGSEVADFNLKNVDGKMLSLSSLNDSKGYIILFTSNHCPFSQAYEERIIKLNEKYKPMGYPVIAINSNDPEAYEDDSFDNMVSVAKEKGYSFPYLSDETQEVGKAFGATRTPQAFVLNKEGGKVIVRYIGAIDDNAQSPTDVSKKYVDEAVNNLINNKPVANPKTKAIGCSIRWK